MSFKDRPEPGTWLLLSKELDTVVNDLLSKVTVDKKHDVPYVAGYSKDGKTIYIDREARTELDGHDTSRYLILHETIERSLEDKPYFLHYLIAHQIALRAERDAVMADGLSWTTYNSFWAKQIKAIGSRDSYPNTPRDLDLQPYRDEDDRATLRKMKFV